MPHRYPFLLVDRVLDFEEGRFLRAVKMFLNEPFFQVFGKPILPGVLILEAMAQATGILAFKSVENWNQASCITSRVSMKTRKTPGRTLRSDDYGSHFRKNPPRPDPF